MKSGTALLLSLLLVMIAASPMTASQAQSSQPRSSASSAAPPAGVNTDSGWPRKIVSGEITLLFYQPQIRKWENNRIEAYAALAVQTAGSDRQTYGVVQFTARTEVDKVNRMVTLEDFHITSSEFPTAPDKASEYAAILQREQLSKVKTIALDRLLANLAAENAEHNFQGRQVKNEAPRIIFSARPAMLVDILPGDFEERDWRVLILKGDRTKEIPKYCLDNQIDLVVMRSRKRVGLPGHTALPPRR